MCVHYINVNIKDQLFKDILSKDSLYQLSLYQVSFEPTIYCTKHLRYQVFLYQVPTILESDQTFNTKLLTLNIKLKSPS